ncbi:MAG: acyl carrier protein [Bacteroidales bacterium]
MNKEEFVQNIANQFDETDPSLFKTDTEFKQLDEWSSLIALSIIAMADESYNVKLKGDDIRNSRTINDLFEVVNSRL